MSSSRRAKSSRQGMTPAPRAAVGEVIDRGVRPADRQMVVAASPAVPPLPPASSRRAPPAPFRAAGGSGSGNGGAAAGAGIGVPGIARANSHQRSSSPAGLSVSSPARCT